MKKYLLSLLLLFCAVGAMAQPQITGVVRDAETGEPLPFANVFYDDKTVVQTGLNGEYKIPLKSRKLKFALVGYKTQTVKPQRAMQINVDLVPVSYTELGTAVVTVHKEKYSRKNNPAVELMKKVIAAKKKNDLHNHDYYSIDKYSRITFAFNEVSDKTFEDGKLKTLSFMKDHIETCVETGKLILPISVDETVSQLIFRKEPRSEKTIIKGKRSTGMNNLFYTGEILTKVIQDCFTDVDIYEDDVRLLQYPFTSPISTRSAIGFYRYFLGDTIDVNNTRAVRVDFTPNNAQDFGFSGTLYIAVDSTYRVLRVDMGIPGRSDVNYVDDMRIIQEFKQLPSGEQVLTKDDMIVQLKVVDFLHKFQVRRTTDYSNFAFDEIPAKTFKFRGAEKTLPDALSKDEAFWEAYREDPLSESEAQLDNFVSKMQKVKGFSAVLWVAKAFIENYVETSTDPKKPSKVDIGPVNTIISQNFVDGLRLRASAQTTAALNPHLFGRGYIAYGFKDHRVKGLAELTYSFLPKAYLPREFPVHSISVSYNNDVMSPSDRFLPTDKDNVFTSFKWTTVDHMMYYETFKLLYDQEWDNNVRLKVSFKREKDEPTASLFYQPLNGTGAPSNDETLWKKTLTTAEATVAVEYQPGAKWMNTKQRRYTPNHDHPVYTLSHTMGFKNFLGGEYAYNFTEAYVYKRFWLGTWGKIDTELKAGIQWNKVPYPLLIMPAANLSYIMEDHTFSLIDNMEFLNDRYLSLISSWDLNGKIFNRIPLFKRLKWREYLGFNMLWGALSDKNNPFLEENAGDSRLFYFPGKFNADGSYDYQSGVMDGKKPYIEVIAGIHNIFKVFHIEYVRRLTYTENLPESRKWGIRGMFRVTF